MRHRRVECRRGAGGSLLLGERETVVLLYGLQVPPADERPVLRKEEIVEEAREAAAPTPVDGVRAHQSKIQRSIRFAHPLTYSTSGTVALPVLYNPTGNLNLN